MGRDHEHDFFAPRVPRERPTPPPSQPRASAGATTLGIVALVLVVGGLGWTLLAGNLGGLVGMPVLLLGTVVGAFAWGRDPASPWGRAAVLVTLGVIGWAVLSSILGF